LASFDGGFCQVALMFLEFCLQKRSKKRQRVPPSEPAKPAQKFLSLNKTPRFFPGRMFSSRVPPIVHLAVGR